MGGWYIERRYAILFYSLLLTITAGPLFQALGFGMAAFDVLLAVNMLAAVVPIDNPRGRRLMLTLLLAAVVFRVGAGWVGLSGVTVWSRAVGTLIALLAAVLALRFSLRATAVTSEHLHAALSAYVLAGLFFGIGYWAIEKTWPGSFGVAASDAGEFSQVSAIYFSFVTLATLGYGDIVPRTDAARGIAIAEAVLGQLYLAVMVARLVSLYVVKRKE